MNAILFQLPPCTICVNLKIFQAVVTTHFLFIHKAIISLVSNISNTIIHLFQLIITLGIHCKLIIRYSTIQAPFAPIKNFVNDLKILKFFFKTWSNYEFKTKFFSDQDRQIKMTPQAVIYVNQSTNNIFVQINHTHLYFYNLSIKIKWVLVYYLCLQDCSVSFDGFLMHNITHAKVRNNTFLLWKRKKSNETNVILSTAYSWRWQIHLHKTICLCHLLAKEKAVQHTTHKTNNHQRVNENCKNVRRKQIMTN